jgi:UDP:flavonoid glycosyltransferase YjiC (YdhE family)
MRILFTFVGGNGHFQPLLPIAQAAEAANHTVAFACGHSMISTVMSYGFAAFPIGAESSGPPERIPLRPLSMEREERDLREKFARKAARIRSAGILALCARWQPDLIVCDEIDFGSMIAAEHLGIPYATVLVIAAGSFVRPEIVAEPLYKVRAEHGLSPDPKLTMLSRYLVLSPFPSSYRDPAFPLPATAHSIRPLMPYLAAAEAPPPFIKHLPDTPTIYFTLGTVFNTESGDLFSRVLTGLKNLRINLVVTVGRHIDPAEFGPQPPNIHIRQYIPQSLVLAHCDAVISHGGSGSVIGALAHGLPMVLIPMGADQPLNGARCEALGVAKVLDAVEATSENVGTAVNTVLEDPTYRHVAEQMRDEIADLPGPEYAVTLLERLAREKRPQMLK